MATYPSPTPGASLLLAFRRQKFAIIGSNTLAASRAFIALEADSEVVLFSKGGLNSVCEELRWRVSNNQITIVDLEALPGPSASNSLNRDAEALDAYLSITKGFQLACVTDTLLGPDASQPRRSEASAVQIARVFQSHNIPVNVTDHPHLCDFTFTSTHRFTESSTNLPTPFQIGVTTNGHGCRLASRFRRDIVAALPKDAGTAVSRVGSLRSLAKQLVVPGAEESTRVVEEGADATPNAPVPQRVATETDVESARRRLRWVAQISEYWPIHKLASIPEAEMTSILDGSEGLHSVFTVDGLSCHAGDSEINSIHTLSIPPPRGRIFLVGSGPGHPSLLTLATHAALTKHANLVLSDKLVPAAVLDIIPKHVEVRIARKFPGNADGAQNELMEAAIEAANRGLTVVRLKQGDPTVYGRAGEEVLYFRAHGYEATVIPGVSSVLAGPTFAGIPVTQRGAAESFIVCTGVGRQGKEVKLPGYERTRTLVLLMGVARLPQILNTLLSDAIPLSRRSGVPYPPQTPIALIERASMPDQRVLCSTLKDIALALESLGEQRPPGMLIIGWSVLSLWETGDVSVLDVEAEKEDDARVSKWLKGARWRVSEGLDLGWEGL